MGFEGGSRVQPIELQRTPFQLTIPPPTQMSAMEVKLVQEEVNKMLGKGAILEVEPWKDQFLSRLFLVPKRDGSFQPVANLKPLNKLITY